MPYINVYVDLSDFNDEDILSHARSIASDIGLSGDDLNFLLDLLETESNSHRKAGDVTTAFRLDGIANLLRESK